MFARVSLRKHDFTLPYRERWSHRSNKNTYKLPSFLLSFVCFFARSCKITIILHYMLFSKHLLNPYRGALGELWRVSPRQLHQTYFCLAQLIQLSFIQLMQLGFFSLDSLAQLAYLGYLAQLVQLIYLFSLTSLAQLIWLSLHSLFSLLPTLVALLTLAHLMSLSIILHIQMSQFS